MATCADLFCGAGGSSEGFRQAGFRVTKALDIWAPAVLTHEKNLPDTEAIRGDILLYAPERLGPVDVLIGSPPCTEFSFANRGGGGNIEEGMRLVYRFLRFVYELRPRWWVMENVPRVLDFLPDEVPLRKLGIDKKGSLAIPVRAVLLSADFGTPQMRRRAFSGDFPIPSPTHTEVKTATTERRRTLRDVVETLPDPLQGVGKGGRAPLAVRDPVYDFDLPIDRLTDHFARDLVLSDEEVRENRKAKEDHSWYGRMSFPDELDRPARTVMATNLRVSRETTVIAASTGGYRRLSVREASSVQGFPITYQWWGATTSLKYKLVGNAVAPPVAFALARAILAAAARPLPERPYVVATVMEPAPAPSERERKRMLPLTRRFREHIPGAKLPGVRVDLDNRGAVPKGHPVAWRAVLYRGSGKALRQRTVGLAQARRMLARADGARTAAFLSELRKEIRPLVPDATTLQLIRAERANGEVTPYVIVDRIGDVVGRHFSGATKEERIAATLVATAYACEIANKGSASLS